nr:hypothetical protein [Tanacetum cinerariifolium]
MAKADPQQKSMAESATVALSCSGAVLGSFPIRVSPSKTAVRSYDPDSILRSRFCKEKMIPGSYDPDSIIRSRFCKEKMISGNSWSDVVKKAFTSPTKRRMIKASRTRDDEHDLDSHEKNTKRRWMFKKAPHHETTTILHRESNNLSTSATTTERVSQAVCYDKKHASVTTLALPEAPMQVEVIPLTKLPFSYEKHTSAALVIQTSFRGYLVIDILSRPPS